MLFQSPFPLRLPSASRVASFFRITPLNVINDFGIHREWGMTLMSLRYLPTTAGSYVVYSFITTQSLR